MFDSRALLVAAATVTGFAGLPSDADALTPLSLDLAIDPTRPSPKGHPNTRFWRRALSSARRTKRMSRSHA